MQPSDAVPHTPPAPQGGDGASAYERRDPGSRATLLIAWIATAVAVTVVVFAQAAGRNAPAPEITAASEVAPPDTLINLIGRYTTGAGRMFGMTSAAAENEAGAEGESETGDDAGATPNAQAEQLLTSLDGFASEPADALRVAIVAGEIGGGAMALKRLDAIAERDPLPDLLREDIAALRTIYGETAAAGDDALAPAARDGLLMRHRWFGRLAMAHGKPDADPERAATMAKATRTIAVALIGLSIAGIATLAGVGLAIAAIVLATRGRLRRAYAPASPGGSVYLEAFAIFLLGFIGVSALGDVIHDAWAVDVSFGLVWLLALASLWPLARGASWRKHRFALGLHAGAPGPGRAARVAREIGAGVLGYIAGLPIFVFGILLTLLTALVMQFLQGAGEQGAPPAHPIINEIGEGGVWGALRLYLLAAVWAPVVEELMFRGCFYHHLRGRLRPLAAGLLVAFVFAAIHPPGIIAVPALMSLAVVFAMIREWRGSIIGCMAAHALHNGALITALLLAVG